MLDYGFKADNLSASEEIIGKATAGIIGVIIAVDEDNIIFFDQDDFDTKYYILEIKDKMKKIVINSISYLNK